MVESIRRMGHFEGWTFTQSLSSGVNGDTIRIPSLDAGQTISVSLVITATGSGKVEFTTSPDSLVISDTCYWQDWPAGVVSATFSDAVGSPVTGLRLVRVSGTVAIEVVI